MQVGIPSRLLLGAMDQGLPPGEAGELLWYKQKRDGHCSHPAPLLCSKEQISQGLLNDNDMHSIYPKRHCHYVGKILFD